MFFYNIIKVTLDCANVIILYYYVTQKVFLIKKKNSEHFKSFSFFFFFSTKTASYTNAREVIRHVRRKMRTSLLSQISTFYNFETRNIFLRNSW